MRKYARLLLHCILFMSLAVNLFCQIKWLGIANSIVLIIVSLSEIVGILRAKKK